MHDLSGFVDAYADNRNQRLQIPCTHNEQNLWNRPPGPWRAAAAGTQGAYGENERVTFSGLQSISRYATH